MLYLLLIYIFGISLVLQLYLILGVFSKVLFYKDGQKQLPALFDSVSIIICAHNEKQNLYELIPVLMQQEFSNLELIVVNDRSEDDTVSILEKFKQQFKQLRVLQIDCVPAGYHPKKYALTKGIQAAKNEIILLTDADCRPAGTQWTSRMVNAFEDEIDIVLGFSPYFKEKSILNALIQYETFYTAVQYLSLTLKGKPYMGVGRNMAYKKSLFLNQQGLKKFQHITGGDDDLFINQAAKNRQVSIQIHQESQMYSIPKRDWRSWYKQKIRHLSVSKYYSLSSKFFLGIINASHVLFWFSFLCIIFVYSYTIYSNIMIGGVMVRLGLLWGVFTLLNQKINAQVHSICIPVFDFLYVLYIFIFGVIALSKKHVQWN